MVVLAKDVCTLRITSPTYLQDIYRSKQFMKLIYNKVAVASPYKNENVQPLSSLCEHNDDSIEAKDLTGNPLEVDLGEDIQFVPCILPHFTNWTPEEATYGPFSLREARQYLNNHRSSDLQTIVCDGKDPRKTLALFSQQHTQLYRGVVRFYGCYELNDEEMAFQNLAELHGKYSYLNNNKFEVEVNTLYSLAGHIKRSADDVPKNVGHSAFIEVQSTEQALFSSNDKYKLFLQVNVSHCESRCYPLWQHLVMINDLIINFRDDDPADVNISENFVSARIIEEDIIQSIHRCKKRETERPQRVDWNKLDVNDMRNLNFMDKLWTHLIHTENVTDLHEILHNLFGYLADNSILQPIRTNQTTLGKIIGGLIDGKIAVPTLTAQASLRLFIELGLNKLHDDYMFLIQDLSGPLLYQKLTEEWDSLSRAGDDVEVSQSVIRKSRMSIAKGASNVGVLLDQLNHIAKLHLCVEFMSLAHTCMVNETWKIYDHVSKFKKTFKSLLQSNIVDADLELISNGYQVVSDKTPKVINIRYTTKRCDGGSATTIFHLSQHPTFPDTVFNDYGVIEKKDETFYYVHYATLFINDFSNFP